MSGLTEKSVCSISYSYLFWFKLIVKNSISDSILLIEIGLAMHCESNINLKNKIRKCLESFRVQWSKGVQFRHRIGYAFMPLCRYAVMPLCR